MVLEEKQIALDAATKDEIAKALKEAQEQYLAVAFLCGSDSYQYGKLLKNFENDYTQGEDHYPKTVTAAYGLLTNWKHNDNHLRFMGNANNGVSFANIDGNNTGNHAMNNNGHQKKAYLGNKPLSQVTCYKCGEKGHLANKCTHDFEKKEKEAEATLVTTDVTADDLEEVKHTHYQFFQSGDDRSVTVLNQVSAAIPKAWILLDNQSIADVFYNKDLLVNVRKAAKPMEIHCNTGVTSTALIGGLTWI
jgi:preprotein translocase subunit Sec63